MLKLNKNLKLNNDIILKSLKQSHSYIGSKINTLKPGVKTYLNGYRENRYILKLLPMVISLIRSFNFISNLNSCQDIKKKKKKILIISDIENFEFLLNQYEKYKHIYIWNQYEPNKDSLTKQQILELLTNNKALCVIFITSKIDDSLINKCFFLKIPTIAYCNTNNFHEKINFPILVNTKQIQPFVFIHYLYKKLFDLR